MNWTLFTPELFCLLVAGVFLCLSMMTPGHRRDFFTAVTLTGIGIGICVACIHHQGDLFFHTYRVDLFSQVFKTLLFMGFFLVVSICSRLNGIEKKYHAEFYLLLATCTLAMMMLVSAVHLLTIFVALELSSYSLYVLVFIRKDRHIGLTSSMKYFLIGATVSAVMLFGMALLYLHCQSAYLGEMIHKMPDVIHKPPVIAGLLFVLCGMFFKLALFPFHFWAPDVYEGAANPVAAYISTASKVAAIGIMLRIISLTGGNSETLAHALVVLAIASMTIGNLSAIIQKDLKRLLAFSSVAHAGYILIGILSMNHTGYTSAIFYAVAVLVMKFTCFLVVVKMAYDGGNITIDRLAGLHKKSPILALALMMALFGLAGIPPTIGFTGKLLIFTAAMEKGYFILVLIAMFNVVVSLYYYILVLKAAYLDEPKVPVTDENEPLMTPAAKLLTGFMIAVMVIAGIYPAPLIEIARAASLVLM